jgi:hypothetical protein
MGGWFTKYRCYDWGNKPPIPQVCYWAITSIKIRTIPPLEMGKEIYS